MPIFIKNVHDLLLVLWFTQVAKPSSVQNKKTESEVVKFFKANCFWLMFLNEVDVMVAEDGQGTGAHDLLGKVRGNWACLA